MDLLEAVTRFEEAVASSRNGGVLRVRASVVPGEHPVLKRIDHSMNESLKSEMHSTDVEQMKHELQSARDQARQHSWPLMLP